MNDPQLGTGQVRHARVRPKQHAFAYPTFFLLLPMRALRAGTGLQFARNRRAAISFWDRDHGDGREDALAWVDETLQGAGITDAGGEVWLHCYPRVLGYAFKPVSFWFCHRADGTLRAVLVEVNNTFGERHAYLLDAPAWGVEQHARKVFHVSPFCAVQGEYRFRFLLCPQRQRIVVRIDHADAQGVLLHTSVSGELQPATPAALRAVLRRHPFLTFGVIARIHWQALRLWAARLPVFRKPAAPSAFLTR